MDGRTDKIIREARMEVNGRMDMRAIADNHFAIICLVVISICVSVYVKASLDNRLDDLVRDMRDVDSKTTQIFNGLMLEREAKP